MPVESHRSRAQDATLRLTGSIGIVVSGADGDAAVILSDADTAIFGAKAAGRNRYALRDEELHRRSKARFSMGGELHDNTCRVTNLSSTSNLWSTRRTGDRKVPRRSSVLGTIRREGWCRRSSSSRWRRSRALSSPSGTGCSSGRTSSLSGTPRMALPASKLSPLFCSAVWTRATTLPT